MTAYEMRISDWSSDVCSSDLHRLPRARLVGRASPGRSDRRRTSTRLAARGAGRIRFMTDAGGHDRLTAMRILATLAFAVAAACAVTGQAACDAPVPADDPANRQPIVPGSEAEPLAPAATAEPAADPPRRVRDR